MSTTLCYGTVQALPVFMLFFGPDIDLFQSFTIATGSVEYRRGGVAKQQLDLKQKCTWLYVCVYS